jgi:hypothetical protein
VYEREEKSLVEPWKQHFQRRQRHYATRWEEALRRCFPAASEDQIAAGAQAAIGMIHSVAHWPRAARNTSELPDLLHRLVIYGLAALEPPARDHKTRDAASGDGKAGKPSGKSQAKAARRGSRARAA